MMKLRYIVIGIFIVFFGSGCTTVTPPSTSYHLENVVAHQTFKKAQGCKKKTLKVHLEYSPYYLMSKDMSYRVGKYQQFKYVTAKWVIPPNKIITTQLEDYLQSSGLFSSVLSMQSYIRSDLVLETDVEDFLQYFSKDKKSSYVILKVKLTLIDLHSNRILESKKFQIKKDVKELSANGGVVAFEQALREFLMQSGLWLSGVCQ